MVLWGIDAADKNEAIKMMVDNLWLQQRTNTRDRLCSDIWAREVPFPTVVGSGFAIPMPKRTLSGFLRQYCHAQATYRLGRRHGGYPVHADD
ncbi:PTS sugar transporter subunit IIA [Klebsiella quasipneumoniae]|uniref:PTS sugar transporter subunit IIA n=1 Tax=Klebsiella quasipneumoniae TaxID=1463165 RepID=UPI0022286B96|nr:PTS sugar transporter subunit IIA [Klebsiella quasipneumoniae]